MLDNLITKLTEGDYSAFEQLYNQTRKASYFVALSVTRDRSLAEDAMQTAYLNVIKYSSRYIVGTNALAWMMRIVRNAALNIVKLRTREQSVDPDDISLQIITNLDESNLLIDVAQQALSQDAFVILMLVSCGYKRREIAEITELPVSTVTFKYRLALKTLRKVLEQ